MLGAGPRIPLIPAGTTDRPNERNCAGGFLPRLPITVKYDLAIRRLRPRRFPLVRIAARWSTLLTVVIVMSATAEAAPLHVKIDALVAEAHPAGQTSIANDADFLRRAYLALHGVIPTATQARAF